MRASPHGCVRLDLLLQEKREEESCGGDGPPEGGVLTSRAGGQGSRFAAAQRPETPGGMPAPCLQPFEEPLQPRALGDEQVHGATWLRGEAVRGARAAAMRSYAPQSPRL